MNPLRIVLLTVWLSALASLATAQIAAYHDVDLAQHQSQVNLLGNAGYRPISITIYGSSSNLRFGAVWVHRNGPNFIPFHGLTNAQYQNLVSANAASYAPTIVSATGSGSSERFAGVLEQTGYAAYAFHGMNQSQLDDAVATARGSGWRIKSLDVYGTSNAPRYIVAFQPNNDSVGWGYYHANDALDHQAKFDGMKESYARPLFAAFNASGRYTSVWEDTILPSGPVHHDLTSAQYDQLANQYWNNNGWYPVNVCADGSGSGARFSAVWSSTDIPLSRQWSVTGPSDPVLAPFDTWAQTFMQANGVRGASLAVVKDGKLKLARGYTWAEPGYGAIQPTSTFRIASLTKPLTSIAVHQQIQKTPGLVNYGATMGSFFGNPNFSDPNQALVDIQDLLTHEGGWDRTQNGSNYDPMFIDSTVVSALNVSYPISVENIRSYMNGQSLDFVPGSNAVYSNYGYALLGRILEQVNPGKTFEQLINERIFHKLGVTRPRIGRSHFADRAPGEVRYHPYTLAIRSSVNDPSRPIVSRQYGSWNQENMYAHGAWIAAAPDLAKVLSCFDLGIFNPILGPTQTSNMFTLDPGASFLKGWWRNGQGTSVELREHNGILPGARCYMGRRVDGISFVFLTNGDRTVGSAEGAQLSAIADNITAWPSHDLFANVGIAPLKPIDDLMSPYGSPCPGSAGTPLLFGAGAADIGDTPSFELVGALPATAFLHLVGTQQSSFDLAQLGAPGCTLLVAPIVMDLKFASTAGRASVPLPLPLEPSLVGQHLFVQHAIYDSAANALGFYTSNGVDLRIGGWLGQ